MNTEKYTAIQKAYKIRLEMFDEGYMYTEEVCHAENSNKAKAILLKHVLSDSYALKSGEDITYLNIPILRAKDYDLVMFEGEKVKRFEIDEIILERKRNAVLEAILQDEAIEYCYIRKGSYYAPNHCGYTQCQVQAGVYTKEEAVKEARHVRDIRLEPINIEIHNKMIADKIKDLQTRLIHTP